MIIIIMILRVAFSIVLVSMVARFLAQIARADFYNPLAQTVVKITDPFLKPLRRIIPPIGGMDTASLIAVLLGQLLLGILILLLSGMNPFSALAQVFVWSIIAVANLLLAVIKWSMIIVAVSSFILMGQYNPFVGFISQIIEPFVGPFRKLNLQVGMLDLSFLIAIMVLVILQDVILLQGVAQVVNFPFRLHLFVGV